MDRIRPSLVACFAALLACVTVQPGCAERHADGDSGPAAAPAPAPPALTGITPATGPADGGTTVTLSGTNFAAGATVTFGGVLAAQVVVRDARTITAVTPNLAPAAGPVDVGVTHIDGAAAVLAGGFLPLSGTSDPGFGNSGAVRVFGFSNAVLTPLACLVNGSDLYVVGEDRSIGPPRWRIERRSTTNGSLHPAFGLGGAVLVTPPAGGSGMARALATDGTHLYVAGEETGASGDIWWRVEKRRCSTGALDLTFGINGAITSNPSSGLDRPRALVVAGGALFIGGTDALNGGWAWRIEARSAANGALLAGFGTGGVARSAPSAGNDELYSLIHSGTGLFAAGSDRNGGSGRARWRVERRSPATGLLDPAFGAGGVVISDPSSNDDHVYTLAAAGSDLYLVGNNASISPWMSQWQIERRHSTTGALRAGFGNNGVVVSGWSPATATSSTMRPTHPYAAATDG
ncbi:MAG: IPT/TIG domain-containing protein, partial [Planctomycetota bacterium]